MNRLLRWSSLLLVLCIVFTSCTGVSPAGGGGANTKLPAGMENLSVVAEDADATGIGLNTAFVISAPAGADLVLLEEQLRLFPETPFTLLPGGETGTFRLLPDETLQPYQIYRLEALGIDGTPARSWAFQTRAPLEIQYTTPYAGSQEVSPDTGIEFVFNRQGVDISGFFSIEPEVAGRFLTYGTRAAFAPDQPLEEGTRYTVTLAEGVVASDGSALWEPYSFSFTAGSQSEQALNPIRISIDDGNAETFLSTHRPVMQITGYDLKGPQAVQVEAYALSQEGYITELAKRSLYNWRETPGLSVLDGLEPALSFTYQMEPKSWQQEIYDYVEQRYTGVYRTEYDWYTPDTLVFPSTLPEGHYLVQVSAADPETGELSVAQRPLQISDTAVYFNIHKGTAVAWVNDAATGLPVGSSAVSLLGSDGAAAQSNAVTGSDGMVMWRDAATGEGAILKVEREGAPAYIDRIYTDVWREYTADELYASALYTERGAYKPTDHMTVWGVARGRMQSEAEAGMRLQLRQGYYYPYISYSDMGEEVLLEQAVELNDDGTFSAQLELQDLLSGYYSICLTDSEDRMLRVETVLVANYQKPELVTSVWSDREFYQPGEPVDMNVQATYYDGTPAYGMPFTVILPEERRGEARPAVYYEPEESGADEYDIADVEVAIPYGGNDRQGDQIWTNSQGVVRAEAIPMPTDYSWEPFYYSYAFYTDHVDQYGSTLWGGATYFPSDMLLLTERQYPDAGGVVLQVHTHALDTSGLASEHDLYENYPENITGVPVDAEISVTLVKNTYYSEVQMQRIASGYDWAAKRTQYRMDYRYNCWTEEEVVASYDTVASGGVLTISDLPVQSEEEENVTWYLTLVTRDSKGYRLEQTVNLYPSFQPYFEGEVDNTVSSRELLYGYIDADLYDETGELSTYMTLSAEGQVNARLLQGSRWYYANHYGHYMEYDEVTTGRMLYYLIEDDIVWARTSDDLQFSLPVEESMMPSAIVMGAYFDGAHIYPVDSLWLEYDYSDRSLEISLEADKERYGPGEEVNLDISVTDREGTGVPARLYLSVVDEAMFAIRSNRVNLLYDLYENYRSAPRYEAHVSYRQYDYADLQGEDLYSARDEEYAADAANPSAGGGGGFGDSGGEYVREDFRDTAIFLELQVDESGQGSASFQLPDNLTSWRITGAAVSEESLMAGDTTIHIDSTMDMFVGVLANDSYLTGDVVGISLTAQGRGLQGSTPVRYRVELLDQATGKVLQTLERKGRSDNELTVTFGQLEQGSYTLRVRGATNDAVDMVQRQFDVVVTNLRLPITERFQLEKNNTLQVQSARYPVLVGFSNQRYGDYLQAASYLVHGGDERLDKKVAAVWGRNFLAEHMPDGYTEYLGEIPGDIYELNLYDYLSDELMALYPYDSGDVELTARVFALGGTRTPYSEDFSWILERYAVFPEVHDEAETDGDAAKDNDELAEEYGWYSSYYGTMTTPDQKAAALMGQAALGKPVLAEIRSRLQEPELFTETGQLYLITGLALLGDQEGAETHYTTLISDLVRAEGGQKRLVGGDNDLGYKNTALALMAASKLGHEDADGLAAYLLGNPSAYYDPVIELAMYLETWQSGSEGESVSFQYRRGGKNQKVQLAPGEFVCLQLMKEELESVKALSGGVSASVSYMGTEEDFTRLQQPGPGDRPEEYMQIAREIRPTTQEDLELFQNYTWDQPGYIDNLYTVTLTVHLDETAPMGRYAIQDRVPSSLQAGYDTLYFLDGERKWSWDWSWDTRMTTRFEKQDRSYSFFRSYTYGYGSERASAQTWEIIYLARRKYAGESGQEPVLVNYADGAIALITPELIGAVEQIGIIQTKRRWPDKLISGGGLLVQTEEEKPDALTVEWSQEPLDDEAAAEGDFGDASPLEPEPETEELSAPPDSPVGSELPGQLQDAVEQEITNPVEFEEPVVDEVVAVDAATPAAGPEAGR